MLEGGNPDEDHFGVGSGPVHKQGSEGGFESSREKVIFEYNFWERAMHTTNLRKVGGSIMLAVPPALLDILHLRVGAKVGLAVQRGRLVVEPQERPHYTLDELLAQCNPKAPRSKEDREWLDTGPAGSELI